MSQLGSPRWAGGTGDCPTPCVKGPVCPHGLTTAPRAVGRDRFAEILSSPEPALGTARRDEPSHALSLAPEPVSGRILAENRMQGWCHSCAVPLPQPGPSRSVRCLGLDATMQKHRQPWKPAQEHSASHPMPAPGSPRPSPSPRAAVACPCLQEQDQPLAVPPRRCGQRDAPGPDTPPRPRFLTSPQGHVTAHQLPTFQPKTPPRSSQTQEDTKLICYSQRALRGSKLLN